MSVASFPGGIQTAHVGLTVRDLERALHYYRDLLGLVVVERQIRQLPGDGSPTVTRKTAHLRLPQTNAMLELVEFDGAGRDAIDPLHGNPGTGHVAFYTADLDETWATLRREGSELQGDAITTIRGGVFDQGKVIYCTDPDGIRVEFLQGLAYLDGSPRDPSAIPDTARANEASHAGIHVSDLDAALRVWVDQLEFELVNRWIANDPGTREVIGLPTANLNMAMLRLPGTHAYLEVIEYQDAPGRRAVDGSPLSPGACHLALSVADPQLIGERLATAGVAIVTDGIATGPADHARPPVSCAVHDGFVVELLAHAPSATDDLTPATDRFIT